MAAGFRRDALLAVARSTCRPRLGFSRFLGKAGFGRPLPAAGCSAAGRRRSPRRALCAPPTVDASEPAALADALSAAFVVAFAEFLDRGARRVRRCGPSRRVVRRARGHRRASGRPPSARCARRSATPVTFARSGGARADPRRPPRPRHRRALVAPMVSAADLRGRAVLRRPDARRDRRPSAFAGRSARPRRSSTRPSSRTAELDSRRPSPTGLVPRLRARRSGPGRRREHAPSLRFLEPDDRSSRPRTPSASASGTATRSRSWSNGTRIGATVAVRAACRAAPPS